ncbi:MAG: transposase [Planctomycetes bacterium]|nr:transposase [Planctomycetota bacterium]
MNRGLARRTVFEGERDMRRFLVELARAIRARRLEVHAYALLSTHFHLLVRSPDGRLAEAMRRVQNGYVRWFNRARRRDGPLFRGRFRSRRVASDEYRAAVVKYIDFNPVEAGLVGLPELYPFGSARCYCGRRCPPWLTRDIIEADVVRLSGAEQFRPQDYVACLHAGGVASNTAWVEARLRSSAERDEELDSLVADAPERVLAWMRRKAALADGTRVGLPVSDPASVASCVAQARASDGRWRISGRGPAVDGWRVADVVLLRFLCGSTVTEIALRRELSTSAVCRVLARHRYLLAADGDYASRISALAHTVLIASAQSEAPRNFEQSSNPACGPENRWNVT